MAARQRDGTGQQADQRMQVEQPGHRDADCILDQHQQHEQHQQDHELATTAGQRAYVGAEAERGEEREQQRVLERLVHGELHGCHQPR